MMKKVMFYLIIGMLVTACQPNWLDDEGSNRTDISPRTLQGEWTWVKTEGAGIAGPYVLTVSGSGDSETRIFTLSGHVTIHRKSGGSEHEESFDFQLRRESGQDVIAYYQNGTLAQKEFIQKDGSNLKFSNYESCCDNIYESLFER